MTSLRVGSSPVGFKLYVDTDTLNTVAELCTGVSNQKIEFVIG